MASAIFVFFSSMAISLLIGFPVVWLLTLLKLGQPVREEGPVSHKVKTGTPTMGGIAIILAVTILSLIMVNVDIAPQYLALLLLMIAFSVIGLVDDLKKVLWKQNLGLSFWQKIYLQVFAAAVFSAYINFSGGLSTFSGILSFFGLHHPLFCVFFAVFLIVGFGNATNLTDGLNGLLAGTAGIAFFSFSVIFAKGNFPEAFTSSLIISGAVFAFLYFNFPRAKVFMGDVGSLGLGAALAGLAIITQKEILLLIVGGIFVIEALSVILQVFSFKLFRRRIFKMSPLHHHFELMGVKETIVVIGFWVAGLVFGILGVLL